MNILIKIVAYILFGISVCSYKIKNFLIKSVTRALYLQDYEIEIKKENSEPDTAPVLDEDEDLKEVDKDLDEEDPDHKVIHFYPTQEK